MEDSNIGVEVLRDPSYIVDDLMEFRNEKVEREIDMPIEYRVGTRVSDEYPENAFYRTFADSSMEMVPRPPAETPEIGDVTDILSLTMGFSTPIEAKPEGIAVHEPVLREAYELLDDEGYTSLTTQEVHARGRTVESTLGELEYRGVETAMLIREVPDVSLRGGDIFLEYDASDQTFSAETAIRNSDQVRQMLEQEEQNLEELLEEHGL